MIIIINDNTACNLQSFSVRSVHAPPPLLIYVAFPLRRAVEAGLALKPRQTAFVAYRLPMFVGRAHRDIRGVRVAR